MARPARTDNVDPDSLPDRVSLDTVWRCLDCGEQTSTIPDGACDCGTDDWHEGQLCPVCSTLLETKGAGGHGMHGQPMAVSWSECPQCQTIIGDDGQVSTLHDQARAMHEARAVVDAHQERDHERARQERARERRRDRRAERRQQ